MYRGPVLVSDEMADCWYEVVSTGAVQIHATVKRHDWSVSRYKHWKVLWQEALDILREAGVDEIFSIVPKDDDLVNKFQRLFGFKAFIEFENCILYKQRI